MIIVTYTVLFLYAVPVFAIAFAAWQTSGFTLRGDIIYMANAISLVYFSFFRDALATLVVPFVTSFSVPKWDRNSSIPRQTLVLFGTLIVFFIGVMILYALVKCRQTELEKFNTTDQQKTVLNVARFFLDTTVIYAKESLTYIALILGITLKKNPRTHHGGE